MREKKTIILITISEYKKEKDNNARERTHKLAVCRRRLLKMNRLNRNQGWQVMGIETHQSTKKIAPGRCGRCRFHKGQEK
jgi:hypothetical protein